MSETRDAAGRLGVNTDRSRRRFLAAGATLVTGSVIAGALPTSADAQTPSLMQTVYASSAGVSAWAPNTAYVVDQMVSARLGTYICSTAHTSGSSFPGVGTYWQYVGPPSLAVYIDAYGADPSGRTSSNSAWALAYAAAQSLLTSSSDNTAAGVVIEFGPGVYQFSAGTVVISNAQIGLRGQGKGVTTIQITGSGTSSANVDGIFAGNSTGTSTQAAAPVVDFTLEGWSCGGYVNGLHYGDRAFARVEVEVSGFDGTGSQNLLFRNDYGSPSGCEGTVAIIHTSTGGVATITFDGSAPQASQSVQSTYHGSFDYSNWWFHAVSGEPSQNQVMCRFVNKGHANGAELTILGNVKAASGYTATVLQVGGSTADTAVLDGTMININVEADSGAGTIYDLVINAASYAGGIQQCWGQFFVDGDGGTVVAGTLSGQYQASMWGNLGSPIFTQAGAQVSQLGTLTAWDASNNQKALVNTATGAVEPGGVNGPGGRVFSGSGAPTSSSPTASPIKGDIYLRTDVPTTANSRIYIYTGSAWSGIL